MSVLVGDLRDNTLTGTANESNQIYGDAYWSLIDASGGDDILTGGANSPSNILYGETQVGLRIEGGNDKLTGGADSLNHLYGDAEFLTSFVNAGEPPALGGHDTLTGGASTGGVSETNYLYGDALSALGVVGGNDRLVSGANAMDHMWGDWSLQTLSTGGNDTFVFGPTSGISIPNNGTDYIYDFHHGEDLIEVRGYRAPNFPIPPHALDAMPDVALSRVSHPYSFSDLRIEETEGNSIIHFDATNNVTVEDTVGLTVDDFLFIA